jgi:hypothetical protein
MHECMHACMFVCLYVRRYVCVHTHTDFLSLSALSFSVSISIYINTAHAHAHAHANAHAHAHTHTQSTSRQQKGKESVKNTHFINFSASQRIEQQEHITQLLQRPGIAGSQSAGESGVPATAGAVVKAKKSHRSVP